MHLFEVTIQSISGGRWPVVAEWQAPGFYATGVTGWLDLDLDALGLEDPAGYGARLGEALFHGEVGGAFLKGLGQSAGQLHVSLAVDDEALKGLRWERLCGPLDGRPMKPVALDQRVFYAIRLTPATPRQVPRLDGRDLRALIVAANPPAGNRYGLEPFDADAAVAAVVASLGPIPADVLGQNTMPPTLDAPCRSLTERHHALLHVVAHGRYASEAGEPVLYLLDDAGAVRPIGAGALTDRLGQVLGGKGLQFVFKYRVARLDELDPEQPAAS